MAEDKIFSKGTIDTLTAKNRIIRSATNDHLGNSDGSVSDAEIEMYDTLARNEIGTIITGHLSVCPDLNLRADEFQLSIGDDRYIDGLRRIASTVHEYGALAVAQISQAGPKGLNPFDFNDLSTSQMEEIRDNFIAAAVRAKEAGFDAVQIHIAHWIAHWHSVIKPEASWSRVYSFLSELRRTLAGCFLEESGKVLGILES